MNDIITKKIKTKLYNHIDCLTIVKLKTLETTFNKVGTIQINDNDKQNLFILIDYIILYYFTNATDDDKRNNSIEIPNKNLRNYISDTIKISLYMQILFSIDLIRPITKSNTLFNACVRYRLNHLLFDLINDNTFVSIPLSKPTINRLNQRKKDHKEINNVVNDLLFSQNKWKAQTNEYINYISKNISFDYNQFIIDFPTDIYSIENNVCLNFNQNKYFTISTSNHRLNTIFTSTNKQLRKYYSIDNKSIETYKNIDLDCSQITLFYSILNLIYQNEYDNFIFKNEIDNRNFDLIKHYINNNITKFKQLQNIFTHGKDIYKQLYPNKTREQAKKATIQGFFSTKKNVFDFEPLNYFRGLFISNEIYLGIGNKFAMLKNNNNLYDIYSCAVYDSKYILYKDISKTTATRLLNDTYSGKNGNQQLAIFLQRVEAYLFVNQFITKATEYKIFNYLTIHDGLFIAQDIELETKSILQDIFINTFGSTHVLKLSTKTYCSKKNEWI